MSGFKSGDQTTLKDISKQEQKQRVAVIGTFHQEVATLKELIKKLLEKKDNLQADLKAEFRSREEEIDVLNKAVKEEEKETKRLNESLAIKENELDLMKSDFRHTKKKVIASLNDREQGLLRDVEKLHKDQQKVNKEKHSNRLKDNDLSVREGVLAEGKALLKKENETLAHEKTSWGVEKRDISSSRRSLSSELKQIKEERIEIDNQINEARRVSADLKTQQDNTKVSLQELMDAEENIIQARKSNEKEKEDSKAWKERLQEEENRLNVLSQALSKRENKIGSRENALREAERKTGGQK